MTKIRIVCRLPEGPEEPWNGKYPRINGIVASIADCAVYAVDDDGHQVELKNVENVLWYAGGAEPAHARITFVDVEIDADAIACDGDLVAADGTCFALCLLCGRQIPNDGEIAACGQCIAERT